MENKVKLSEIISFLGEDVIQIHGTRGDFELFGISAIDKSEPTKIDWIHQNNSNAKQIAESSKAKLIISSLQVEYSEMLQKDGKVLIQVENPYYIIAAIGNEFFIQTHNEGIHPSAVIDAEAKIGKNVHIGALCYIGKCVIGDDCIIHNNVSIGDGVTVASRVQVFQGAILGTNGLGCFRKEDRSLQAFPHLGGLSVEDDVIIGANCSIAKGSFSDTIIGKGSKINALCFIAHNCTLGKNVLITGSSMLNGSVKIGDNTTIYSQVIIRDQAFVGKNVIIGMGSVVTKDIPSNEIWIGNPARFLRKNEK